MHTELLGAKMQKEAGFTCNWHQHSYTWSVLLSNT